MSIAVMAILFFVLMFAGIPMGIAMAGSSFAAIFLSDLPGVLVPQRTFVMLDSFSLMAVPIFILAGEVMGASGITTKIVRFASSLVGHFKAGLGQASILAGMMMAGISGSAAADASALGSILIPAMVEDDYDPDFAVSIIAAANTIGPIIPPSIMMIIYGSMTGTSIGGMFIGGYVPGILFGLCLMLLTYFIARRRNYRSHARATLREVWKSLKEAIWALIMPVIIIGGIMSGVFTATESGVIAVVYAFIVGFVNGSIKPKDIRKIFIRAAKGTTTPMFLIGIASVFGWLLARNDFPAAVGSFMMGITTNPNVFIVILWVFFLLLGCFMEDTAAMIIMCPVMAPIAAAYGFDPVHFGVFTVVTLLIGTITPPVGMLLFICCSIAKIKVAQVVRTVAPFAVALALMALLVGLFPGTVTTLVNAVFS